MGIAPSCAAISREGQEVCSMARVTTTRFPSSGDEVGSATLAAHFFEDVLRAGVDQETRHFFAERARLIGWTCERADGRIARHRQSRRTLPG